ncbi:MAG: methyltransferase, partial [Planctomycetota bacterium]
MILKRDNANSKSALISNWSDHYARHVNPELMTQLLRTAVPVLDEMKWRVTEVEEGFAASVLPLAKESTNQHGTHQAALIALSADYTGGLALATLLTGVPLAGIHKCTEEDSASLWLADMSVRFRAPSTGHLKA